MIFCCMRLRNKKLLPEMVRPNFNVSTTTNAASASNATPVANASNAHNDVPNLQQCSQK